MVKKKIPRSQAMNVLEKSFLSLEVSVLMAFRGFQEMEGVNATVSGGY